MILIDNGTLLKALQDTAERQGNEYYMEYDSDAINHIFHNIDGEGDEVVISEAYNLEWASGFDYKIGLKVTDIKKAVR